MEKHCRIVKSTFTSVHAVRCKANCRERSRQPHRVDGTLRREINFHTQFYPFAARAKCRNIEVPLRHRINED